MHRGSGGRPAPGPRALEAARETSRRRPEADLRWGPGEAGGRAGIRGSFLRLTWTGSGAAQQATSPAEEAEWAAAERADTAAAYQRYLEFYPMGIHMEEAFRRIVDRSLQRAPDRRLIDIAPALGPAGEAAPLSVAAADLSLY